MSFGLFISCVLLYLTAQSQAIVWWFHLLHAPGDFRMIGEDKQRRCTPGTRRGFVPCNLLVLDLCCILLHSAVRSYLLLHILALFTDCNNACDVLRSLMAWFTVCSFKGVRFSSSRCNRSCHLCQLRNGVGKPTFPNACAGMLIA